MMEEHVGIGFRYLYYNPTSVDLFVDLDKHKMYSLHYRDLGWFKMDNNIIIVYSKLILKTLSNKNIQWLKLLYRRIV
jgi:hypothetical protein